MALFGKKKQPAKPPAAEDEGVTDEAVAEVSEESPVELKAEALKPKKALPRSGVMPLIVGMAAITVVGAGGGIGLGMQVSASIERAIADRDARAPSPGHAAAPKYTGDMVLKPIQPVITNLASPPDTWIRLESAIVFKNGALPNAEVTAAEIRQDQLAYLRTIDISQLQGPSALQHLREDLSERAAIRSAGKVIELIIETLIVQ